MELSSQSLSMSFDANKIKIPEKEGGGDTLTIEPPVEAPLKLVLEKGLLGKGSTPVFFQQKSKPLWILELQICACLCGVRIERTRLVCLHLSILLS
jgi:hypothetical protein